MKPTLLPEGMIVLKKMYHGKGMYKMRTIIGFIRTGEYTSDCFVNHDSSHQLIIQVNHLDRSISCMCCKDRFIPWDIVSVLN